MSARLQVENNVDAGPGDDPNLRRDEVRNKYKIVVVALSGLPPPDGKRMPATVKS